MAVAGGGAWEVALVRQLEEYISAKGVVRYDFVTASQGCYTPVPLATNPLLQRRIRMVARVRVCCVTP